MGARPTQGPITRPRRIVEGIASMIHKHAKWSLFTTHTFTDDISIRAAGRAFQNYMRHLSADVFADHFEIGWGADIQQRGVPHFHALVALKPSAQTDTKLMQWLWSNAHFLSGHSKVENYDPRQGYGAAMYLAEHRHYGLGVVCPRTQPRCRRPSGCREGKSPWW